MNSQNTEYIRLNGNLNNSKTWGIFVEDSSYYFFNELVGCCGQIYGSEPDKPTRVIVFITIDKGEAKGRSIRLRLPRKACDVISGEAYATYISKIFPPTSFVLTHGDTFRPHFGIVQKITKESMYCELWDVQDGSYYGVLGRQPSGFIPISNQVYKKMWKKHHLL